MATENYLPENWANIYYGPNWEYNEEMLPDSLSCKHIRRKHYKDHDTCMNCFETLCPTRPKWFYAEEG